jgi:cobalt transporter subunit CbtB
MTSQSIPATHSSPVAGDRTAIGAVTLLVGLMMVYFVGFAPLSAVHNAAHDTRHSAAFPCH